MTFIPSSEMASGLYLSDTSFFEIVSLMKEESGICLAEGAQKLVIARLSRHVKRLKFHNFDEYLDHIKSAAGCEERELMISSLTTNTTQFFRERGHFDLLQTHFMDRLISKARSGKRVRLWSAACSSGEEAYSIAATVVGSFPEVRDYDFRILGTDINKEMLVKAEDGLYESSKLNGVSSQLVDIMFDQVQNSENYLIKQNLRDLVSFKYLNFMEDWPVRGPFDVIFCRNVAIYMDADTQMKIWSGLERVLDDEGALFIGHSERIGASLSHRLTLFGPTSFCRPGRNPVPAGTAKEQSNVSS